MRACPHCSGEIQEEAMKCRHCRRQVEPPMWLASMRRCPACAEWIEQEQERCPYCDTAISVGSPERTAPFVESSLDDLVGGLRREAAAGPALRDDLGLGDARRADEAKPAPAEEALLGGRSWEAEPEPPPGRDRARPWRSGWGAGPEPPPEKDRAQPRRSSWEAQLEAEIAAPRPQEREPAERRLGPFRLRRKEPEPEPQYERPEPLFVPDSGREAARDQRWEEAPSSFAALPTGRLREASSLPRADREAAHGDAATPGGRGRVAANLGRLLTGLFLVGAVGVGGFLLLRGPGAPLLAQLLATEAPPSPTPPPAPTNTLSRAPTLPPAETATVPTSVSTEVTGAGECLSWEQVTVEDAGKQLCVFGVVRRWFAVEEVPFVAIFSEEAGTFALVDRSGTHPVGPGDCVMGTGVVEVMRGTRPNIDVQGELLPCPSG